MSETAISDLPLEHAASWLQAALLGSIATAVAMIGVAGIGITMLSGRVPLRRTFTVLLGAFVLFGAPTIAVGLVGLADVGATRPQEATIVEPLTAHPSAPRSTPYDPYAGAAVPQSR